jgi:DNA polymerase-3 subunit gamma/tau
MRDALSIMDQAIASAPVENGKAVLSATQIRELMGAVPNAIFERLLEAVAAGQSAELMQELNVLVNAGHSPSSLARQMVRYLRNTLMAKIGGEQTELLQISADERARAARTALLFTEEELTRNLQIVLRTFDDLNYRQEQRFHLELGLLKLIHAQRLLPIEELLSGVAAGGGFRAGAPALAQGSAPRPSARSVASSAPATAPSLSPFGSSSGNWSSGPKSESSLKPDSAASPAATVKHAVATQATGFASTATLTEGALAKAPQATVSAAPIASVESIRQAVSGKLAEAGHVSASQLLGSGKWALDGSNLRIEVAGMGKKMLALTVNAAAEKIIRQELKRLGAPTRFMVVPGEGSTPSAEPMAAPIAGSVQEAALANPLVQRAKEIFKAEVRSVVDLRQA